MAKTEATEQREVFTLPDGREIRVEQMAAFLDAIEFEQSYEKRTSVYRGLMQALAGIDKLQKIATGGHRQAPKSTEKAQHDVLHERLSH